MLPLGLGLVAAPKVGFKGNTVSRPAGNHGLLALHNGSLFKTESGCTDFRTGRSKPVTELCKSNVGFVAMISTIVATGTRHKADVVTIKFGDRKLTPTGT
jgi:hypothetical protein